MVRSLPLSRFHNTNASVVATVAAESPSVGPRRSLLPQSIRTVVVLTHRLSRDLKLYILVKHHLDAAAAASSSDGAID